MHRSGHSRHNSPETKPTKPTLAGVHYKENGIGFTVRFLGGYHAMSPSYKQKGDLPINKKGELHTRCFNGG